MSTKTISGEIPKGNVTWGIGWIGEGNEGALIIDIVPKGPAAKVGLTPGDVISSVDGHPIKNSAELKQSIKNSRPYTPVQLIVQRFGTRLEKTLLPAGMLRLEVRDLDRSYKSFNIPGVPGYDFLTPVTALDALDTINVLQNVVIDPKSGQIAVIGVYDPRYATGPIPYLDLLKTALKFPQPGLNLTPVKDLSIPELITPWEFFEEILGAAGAERERQALIREMAKGYGLSREEYVQLYNYAFLEAQGELAPAEIERLLVKAYRHLGLNKEADVQERMRSATVEDFRQILRIIDREKQFEHLIEGKQLTKDRVIGFTSIAILDAVGMPQDEIRELLARAEASQISPAEILQRMYRYVVLYLYDIAGAKKEGEQTTDPKMTIGVSRPIWRAGPKIGVVPVDSARTSGDALVRIETINTDANSQFARIMYEADYALKAHSSTDLFDHIPGHLKLPEYLSRAAEIASSGIDYNNNLWLEPRRIEIQISADKSVVVFGAAEISLNAGFNIRGVSTEHEQKIAQTLTGLAKQVTDNYELYARVMPAWHRLREAAKILALARMLKERKIFVDLDAVQQERWDNPRIVPGFSHRYFVYYRKSSEGPSGHFNYLIGRGAFGGVNLSGRSWTSYGPASKTTEAKVPDQLVLSSQLGQRAAQAANRGDLDSARHLAELSAQALTGRVSRVELARQNIVLPSVPTARPSPARVQLQRELLKETAKQIYVLRQNPSNTQAAEKLRQLNTIYNETQSRPVTPSDINKLRTVLRPVPPLPSTLTTGPVLTEISLEAIFALQKELQQRGKPIGKWIEDQIKDSLENLKDELKDQAIDAILDRMPFSEALKHEISIQINLMKRYNELFGQMREDSDDFLVGWNKDVKEAAWCLATRSDCAAVEGEIERLTSKFADKSSNRWFPWLQQDIEGRQ